MTTETGGRESVRGSDNLVNRMHGHLMGGPRPAGQPATAAASIGVRPH